jgi:hypothetical protein
LQYLLFAVMLTVLYAVYQVFSRQSWREKGLLWFRFALIGAAWGVVALPLVIVPALIETANNAWLNPSEGSSLSKSTDFSEYFSLDWHNLGYFALVLAGLGLVVAWRKAGYWAVAAGFFGLMSLGRVLQVNGTITGIPLPYDWFNNLPGMSVGRNPSLFQVVWMLAVAAVATYGVAWLLERFSLPDWLRSGVIAFGLVGLVVPFMLQYAADYRLDPLGTSAFFEQLAKDKETFAIYEIPPFTDKGRGENVYQAYQIIHRKPRFGGRMARDHKLDNPNNFVKYNTLFRDFFWSSEIMQDLRPSADFLATPDYKRVGLPLLNFYRVRYIVLYKAALEGVALEKRAYSQKLINELLNNPKPVFEDNLLVAYRVPVVDPRSAGIFGDVGEGWFSVERNAEGLRYRWADPKFAKSEFYLYNLNPNEVAANFSFQAYSFKTERELVVQLNGREIKRLNLSEARQSFSLDLRLSSGRNVLTFTTAKPALAVADFGFKNDSRNLTFGMLGIELK